MVNYSVSIRALAKIFLFAAASLIAGCSRADDAQAAEPARVRVGPPPAAPSEVADFLAKAKAADSIADPLARCLAFPDIPGNSWPAGLAQSQCKSLFESSITSKQIKEFLDRGQAVELDALFSKDLDRHFSETDFSEVIHRDFDSIGADEESNLLTERWLKMAPKSPFALEARGKYFRAMAGHARGSNYAQQTPAENMQRMSEFAQQAIDYFEKSLKADPRMMPALGGLIVVGTMSSRPDVMKSAFERGMAIDPGCTPFAVDVMNAMQPRWGGDYSTMQKFSEQLSTQLDRRPLLAVALSNPYSDQADALYDAQQYQESMDVLSNAAKVSTDPHVFEDLARAMTKVAPGPKRWEIVMNLLEVTRYRSLRQWAVDELYMDMFMTVNDSAWALSFVEGMSARQPDDAYAHYFLGTHYMPDKPAEAEQQLLLAMPDPERRRDSIAMLLQLAKTQKQPEKVHKYFEMLSKEYPDYVAAFGITES